MHYDGLTRRDFVAAMGTLGGLWLVADTSALSEALDHARHQSASRQRALLALTAEQAAEVDAIASRIFPTDDVPGAHEAGVVYFFDKSLTTFAKDQRPALEEGLKKLADTVAATFPGSTRFSRLTVAQQDQVLKSIEQTPFFGLMRTATILGMFALPEYGGNRDFVGWKMLGESVVADFKPPFGWYDRPENRRALLGGEDE